MIKPKPTISVLMLSYNHIDYIENAISSVFLNVNDLYELDLFVIDDGSSDGTVELLQRLKATAPIDMEIILKKHEGVTGIARNLNQLIRRTTSDYFSFLASDDEFTPHRFLKQLDILQSDPECVLVYGNGQNKVDDSLSKDLHSKAAVDLLSRKDPGRLRDRVISGVSPFFIQSVLARTNFFQEYEPFDNDLIADDWVFNIKAFTRIEEYGKGIDFVNETLFLRNVHANQTSKNRIVHFQRIRQVAERYCINGRQIIAENIAKNIIFALRNGSGVDLRFFIGKTVHYPTASWYIVLFLIQKLKKLIVLPQKSEIDRN